jgi:hypothetical protein
MAFAASMTEEVVVSNSKVLSGPNSAMASEAITPISSASTFSIVFREE